MEIVFLENVCVGGEWGGQNKSNQKIIRNYDRCERKEIDS
jgi:hypothetical protein